MKIYISRVVQINTACELNLQTNVPEMCHNFVPIATYFAQHSETAAPPMESL